MLSRTDWTDTGQMWAYKAKATELIIIKYNYKYNEKLQ